jgi:hypothetical protein
VTWSYSGDPSANDRDAVRFLITDTDSADPLVGDEELEWLLTRHGSVNSAAVEACRQISRQFARAATGKQVGDLRLEFRTRAKDFADLADRLEAAGALVVSGKAGGISVSRKRTVEADSDRTTPSFRRGLHDHPEASQAGGRAFAYDSTG